MAGRVTAPPPESPIMSDKELASKIIETLDEQSLWKLAQKLHEARLLDLFAVGGGSRSPPLSRCPPASPICPPGSFSAPPGIAPPGGGDVATATLVAEAPQRLKEPAETAQPPEQATVAVSEGAAEGAADDAEGTTLILRNLPPSWDFQKCRDWVDAKFAGRYDFLQWFPSKKTARHNSSYAFVNFLTSKDAKSFRRDHHGLKLVDASTGSSADLQTSITTAKTQGFEENYVRYGHLSDAAFDHRCRPYFDPAVVARLPESVLQRAKRTGIASHDNPVEDAPKQGTTIIVRNLPGWMDTQVSVRRWFDAAGYAGMYDFFVYIPSKKRSTKDGAGGLAYVFVNFRDQAGAKECIDKLHGMHMQGSESLNVVYAKVQGCRDCTDHFRRFGEPGGNIDPWISSAEEYEGGHGRGGVPMKYRAKPVFQ